MNLPARIKILRPANLLILALSQYFIDLFILQPIFNKYGLLFTFDEARFFLLVLSTLLICGAGYIINDYFDVKADAVNKPSKQIVGKSVTAEQAFRWYMILTVAGIAIGTYLSIYAGNWKLVTIHIIAVFLLYAYSASFQKVALLGNLIVALLSALGILIIGAFEPHLYNLARPGDYYAADLCWQLIFGISIFAFLLTMIREIVKDIEDVNGDKRSGLNTMPIAWGIPAAKIVATVFILITIVLTWYFYNRIDSEHLTVYLVFVIILSLVLVFTAAKLFLAHDKKHYASLSLILKISMLIGLCFMPLYFITEF